MTAADPPDLAAFRIRQEQRRAQAYAEFFAPVTAQFLAPLADRLGPPRAGGRRDAPDACDRGPVLDLGCGTGSLARILSGRGWTVVAADRWPAMAALARSVTGPPVVVADAVRLPVGTASLGALAAAFVLPHLSDLPGALGEIRRVLRPGAPMVLAGWAGPATSPFTGLAATLLRERAVPEVRDIIAEAERRTDPAHLCGLMRDAGFDVAAADTVHGLVRLPSATAWWTGVSTASSGFVEALQAHSLEVRRDTRSTFLDAASSVGVGDVEVLVPLAALLLTAHAPGSE